MQDFYTEWSIFALLWWYLSKGSEYLRHHCGCVTLIFPSACGNVKNADQGSLRDKTVREQLPDRRLLACMRALFVYLWIPARQNTLRIRLMRLITLLRNRDKNPSKAIFWCESDPKLLAGMISFTCVTVTLIPMFLITSLAIIASQVRVH